VLGHELAQQDLVELRRDLVMVVDRRAAQEWAHYQLRIEVLADEIPDSHRAGGVPGQPLRLDLGLQAITPGHGLRSGVEDL